jgi:hypothetical protein
MNYEKNLKLIKISEDLKTCNVLLELFSDQLSKEEIYNVKKNIINLNNEKIKIIKDYPSLNN